MTHDFNYRLFLLMLIALNFSIIFSVASESVEQNRTNASESESDSCLFIEVSQNIDETTSPHCFNFSCFHSVPLIRLTYAFNGSELIVFHYLNFSPSPIKVIVACNYIAYGASHGGIIYQITEFPFSACNLITILNVSNDIVNAAYQSQHFILNPGDSWSNRTQEIEVQKYSTITITREVLIENHGRVKLIQKGSPVLERCNGIWC